MSQTNDIGAIARQFQAAGEFVRAVPIGSGHIHDSLQVTFQTENGLSDFVLQRINTRVFTQPAELMQNVLRISSHLTSTGQYNPDFARRSLQLIPTQEAGFVFIDEAGFWWRMFRFIPGARAFETVTPEQAWHVAHAIGRFQSDMAGMRGPRLFEPIPDFHNTPLRLAALQRAIVADVAGRRHAAQEEIEFALARKELASLLTDANLPERIAHNDAKSSNVLLDESTGEALCVIDLDTVMPGLAVNDFGDMMRSMTSPAPEDEQDLSRVFMRFELYQALLDGYASAAVPLLTKAEIRMLPAAGKTITYENGLRFLADYLAGDTYYKINYSEHNLHRCRTQFQLVRSMEEQELRMIEALQPFL